MRSKGDEMQFKYLGVAAVTCPTGGGHGGQGKMGIINPILR